MYVSLAQTLLSMMTFRRRRLANMQLCLEVASALIAQGSVSFPEYVNPSGRILISSGHMTWMKRRQNNLLIFTHDTLCQCKNVESHRNNLQTFLLWRGKLFVMLLRPGKHSFSAMMSCCCHVHGGRETSLSLVNVRMMDSCNPSENGCTILPSLWWRCHQGIDMQCIKMSYSKM
jgi:hypothetical protein